jgi:hypothetical protein
MAHHISNYQSVATQSINAFLNSVRAGKAFASEGVTPNYKHREGLQPGQVIFRKQTVVEHSINIYQQHRKQNGKSYRPHFPKYNFQDNSQSNCEYTRGKSPHNNQGYHFQQTEEFHCQPNAQYNHQENGKSNRQNNDDFNYLPNKEFYHQGQKSKSNFHQNRNSKRPKNFYHKNESVPKQKYFDSNRKDNKNHFRPNETRKLKNKDNYLAIQIQSHEECFQQHPQPEMEQEKVGFSVSRPVKTQPTGSKYIFLTLEEAQQRAEKKSEEQLSNLEDTQSSQNQLEVILEKKQALGIDCPNQLFNESNLKSSEEYFEEHLQKQPSLDEKPQELQINEEMHFPCKLQSECQQVQLLVSENEIKKQLLDSQSQMERQENRFINPLIWKHNHIKTSGEILTASSKKFQSSSCLLFGPIIEKDMGVDAFSESNFAFYNEISRKFSKSSPCLFNYRINLANSVSITETPQEPDASKQNENSSKKSNFKFGNLKIVQTIKSVIKKVKNRIKNAISKKSKNSEVSRINLIPPAYEIEDPNNLIIPQKKSDKFKGFKRIFTRNTHIRLKD